MARDGLWSQVAAAVVMSMTPAIYGTTLSFAAHLLAESQSADATAQLTLRDATMVAAISNLGRMFACVASAPLTDRLGVPRVIQLSMPLNLLAWPLMTLGGRSMMVAGAVMAGAFVGLSGLPGRLYIAEVTASRYRSTLCYIPGVTIGISLLANFSIGAVIPWRYASLLCGCVPSVVQIIGTIMLPDSPRWLVHRGASGSAVNRAIVFFRGRKADVAQEAKDIELSIRGRSNISLLRQVHLVFTDWDVAKPCLLMFVQFFFETFCGGVVLNQYALSVFQTAAMSLTPSQGAQLLAVLQTVAICVSGFLLHWWGRRTVLIGSAVLTGLGQLTAAAYFHFEAALSGHTWLVMVGIIVANAASMGGISQLSHLYLGETLPVSVRQMYGSAISLYMGALSMAFIHLFPVLKATLGLSGLFAALAGVNVLQVVFARCLLPETRGLSLEQVQFRHFSTKRRAEEEAEAAVAATATREAHERPKKEMKANGAHPGSEEGQVENGTVTCETSGEKQTDTDRATPDTDVTTPDIERAALDTEVATFDTAVATFGTKVATLDTGGAAPDSKMKRPDTERSAPDTEEAPPDAKVATLDTKVATADTKVTTPDIERAAPDTEEAPPDTKVATLDTKVATADTKRTAPDTEVAPVDTKQASAQPAA